MVGIDLVYIPEFAKNLDGSGEAFLLRTFLPVELKNKKAEHLAGLFAAKEAVIKAVSLPIGSWLEIEITSDSKPVAIVSGEINIDISISHHGDYAVAVAIKKDG